MLRTDKRFKIINSQGVWYSVGDSYRSWIPWNLLVITNVKESGNRVKLTTKAIDGEEQMIGDIVVISEKEQEVKDLYKFLESKIGKKVSDVHNSELNF